MTESLCETSTEEKLRVELANFEQQYQPENLEGLPIKTLQRKVRLAIARYKTIISRFPRKKESKSSWQRMVQDDRDESLSPLTQEQQMEAEDVLERCVDNIIEAATRRKDERQAEKWDLISFDSLSIISFTF
jgi:hypothetical protein